MKQMKKKHLFLVLIASLAMCVSCSDGDGDSDPMLDMPSQSFSVAARSSQFFIPFNCNTSWKASSDASWCKLAQTEGQGSNELISIYVDIEANPIALARTAKVTIQAGSLMRETTVEQAAGTATLSISPTFIQSEGTENTFSITVTSNAQWSAMVNDAVLNSWCTITPSSGFGDGTITVSVARNHGYARRAAFISVVSDGIQKTDTIFQKGGETYSDPSIPVTINGITWASRNVDKFGFFTDFLTDQGKYYQFNRSIGYSFVNGNAEPTMLEYVNENSDWELFNDPCPCGWRLPTYLEVDNLRTSGYRWVNEPAGAWYGSDAASATFEFPGNAIFLPAGGIISSTGMSVEAADWGYYWTKQQNIRQQHGHSLWFRDRTNSTNEVSKGAALFIRCVQE